MSIKTRLQKLSEKMPKPKNLHIRPMRPLVIMNDGIIISPAGMTIEELEALRPLRPLIVAGMAQDAD